MRNPARAGWVLIYQPANWALNSRDNQIWIMYGLSDRYHSYN